MPAQPTAEPGPLGGAANEAGSEFRARVGALLATAVMRNESLGVVGLEANASAAILLHVESDDPVDDLVVHLASGDRVYVQAKRRVDLRNATGSPLSAAIDQFARAVRSGLTRGDRLVLASARPSAPLQRLGDYLNRRRLAAQGAPTTKELEALSAFKALAARLAQPDEVDQVLDHLVVWPTDPTRGDGEGMLASRLDGHIAVAGAGLRAMRELSDEVRALARARGGRDPVQFAEALAARGVPLSPSAPATSPVAWATALAAYRERAVRRGTTLDLFGAPPQLRHLSLRDADAGIEVDVPESDSPLGRDLVPALRRRGRVLLLGGPGGGKSTALRASAAHWAARPDWPVPIDVHLQRIASSSHAPLDAILDSATSHLPAGPGRETLRLALSHELARGRCLLLLDGLDEVRRGRAALVADLSEMFDDLHEAVEIVLSARPVAVADGRDLGLRELTLRPPEHAMTTVEAILEAGAPDPAPDDWVEDRRAWVQRALDRDGALARTPLTVVVLAVVAVSTDELDDLPTSRAAILQRALTDVIDRWEVERRHRGDVTIGQLRDSRARGALTRALLVLSTATLADEPPTRAGVLAALKAALAEDFELPAGEAQAAAEDAARFWEDAGLFDLSDGELRASIRQFAELGNAWGPALEGRPDPGAWVTDARSVTDLWASLALGAGLAAPIAETWAQAVASDGSTDELIALVDAIGDGASVTTETLVAVADAAADRLISQPADAERTAEALIALPLPADIRRRLRPRLTADVPPERRDLVDAMAIVRWDEHDNTSDDRLRAFVAAAAPPRPNYLDEPQASPNVFVIPQTDDAYASTFELAAVRVAQLSRRDAERVLERFEDGSMQFRTKLQQALRQQGHHDLASQVNADLDELTSARKALFSLEEYDATTRHLLLLTAKLAPPAVLTQQQLRRLDELCDFHESALLDWIRPAFEKKHPAAARCWIEAVARLGGFDLAVLAAQAALVLADLDAGEPTDGLMYDAGRRRPLTGWDTVADPEPVLGGLVDAIGRLPRQASTVLAMAIASSPIPQRAVDLLDALIPKRGIWARELTALTLVVTADEIPDEGTAIADAYARCWLDGNDPFLRAAAAAWWSWRRTAAPGEFERCLRDPDAGVRRTAVDYLRPEALTPALRERLEALRRDGPCAWTCDSCGHQNPSDTEPGCKECRTSRPDIAGAVRDLLGDRPGRRTVEFAPAPRRVRRFPPA